MGEPILAVLLHAIRLRFRWRFAGSLREDLDGIALRLADAFDIDRDRIEGLLKVLETLVDRLALWQIQSM